MCGRWSHLTQSFLYWEDAALSEVFSCVPLSVGGALRLIACLADSTVTPSSLLLAAS